MVGGGVGRGEDVEVEHHDGIPSLRILECLHVNIGGGIGGTVPRVGVAGIDGVGGKLGDLEFSPYRGTRIAGLRPLRDIERYVIVAKVSIRTCIAIDGWRSGGLADDVLQSIAPGKRPGPDRGNVLAQGDVVERGAVLESPSAEGGDALRQGDGREIVTAGKGIFSNGSHAIGHDGVHTTETNGPQFAVYQAITGGVEGWVIGMYLDDLAVVPIGKSIVADRGERLGHIHHLYRHVSHIPS